MMVRDAVAEDASEICDVLKRSILELCVLDHRNDSAILGRWLRNKTPEHVASWIATPGNFVLVAIDDAVILGVGLVTDAGEIGLNYVAPEARFRGISRDIMHALESRARECGNTRCTLTSTETARRFYLSGGYTEEGEAALRFPGDITVSRMSKTLEGDANYGR